MNFYGPYHTTKTALNYNTDSKQSRAFQKKQSKFLNTDKLISLHITIIQNALSVIKFFVKCCESFVNANYATFINFINFRVYCNECTVTEILVEFFLLANNFGTGKRIKFGWNESIIPKCHIIKPMAVLKED